MNDCSTTHHSRFLALAALLAATPALAADPPATVHYAPAAELLKSGALLDGWQPGTEQGRGPVIHAMSNGAAPECDNPTAVRFTPDGQHVLITNEASRVISVYDVNTRQLLRTIPVTDRPYDVEVLPDGVHAITANLRDNSASIVDYATGAELAVLDVGQFPSMALVSPDGTFAAVGNALDETWSIIDTATQSVVRTVDAGGAFGFGFGGGDNGVVSWTYKPVILPDNRLVLQDWNAQVMNFVDLATGAIESVAVLPNGMFFTATPDGSRVVVVHNPVPDPLSLTIIDTATTTIEDVWTHPYQSLYNSVPYLAMRPDGTKVAFWSGPTGVMTIDLDGYATAQWYGGGALFTSSGAGGDYMLMSRGRCNTLLDWATGQPVMFGGAPEFCAPADWDWFSPAQIADASPVDSRVVMISAQEQEDFVVFNLDGEDAHVEACTLTAIEPEADRCWNMAVTGDGSLAVGLNQETNNVTIFDLDAGTIVDWVEVGEGPRGAAITPDDSRALIVNELSSTITLLDLATLATTSIDVPGCSGAIVIDAAGDYAYFAHAQTDVYPWEGRLYRLDLATLQVDSTGLDVQPAITNFSRTIGLLYDMTWAKPAELTISHDGATMCVCGGYGISLVDLTTWTEVRRLTLPGDSVLTSAARFSSDDALIYVLHYDQINWDVSYITVVSNDGGDAQILQTVPVGTKATDMVMNESADMLYIACRGSGPADTKEVVAFDLDAVGVVGRMPLPDPNGTADQRPIDVKFSADGSVLYSVTTDGYLHTLDPASFEVLDSQPTGAISGCRFAVLTDGVAIVSPHDDVDGVTLALLTQPCPEDLDGDGHVGQADLGILLAAYNTGPGGDIDGDGDTDQADLGALLSVYGQDCQ